tara:strand:- start:1929 stop:2207 length:279 start_codon:yes stop_codon:yes gene_type:complete
MKDKSQSIQDSYRKKFPKGKDWREPTPNPFTEGGSGISSGSYHNMKVIAISMDKHNEIVNELERKIEELTTELYYCRRNRKIEDVIKKLNEI